MGLFSRMSHFIDTILFGREIRCAVCGRLSDRSGMCAACKSRIPYVIPPICLVCGVPLRAAGRGNDAHASESSDGPVCRGCLTNRHYFERARAVAVHDGAARDHIHELKYRARIELAPAMARMMAEVAITDGMAAECECVVPVPLHPKKAATRGFNQAELLARDIGLLLGIPVEAVALHREREAGSQTFLKRRDRRANVVRAFSCLAPAAVAERNLLLVDDVITSGATADGCARALLRAGAAKVYVLTYGVSIADDRDWLGYPRLRDN